MTTPSPDADLRFPLGPMPTEPPAPAERAGLVARIEALPAELRAAVAGLDDAALDTPYREGGWTVRQVAHHVPDSHLNAYVRVKLALTEDAPVIKPYDEEAWARLADSSWPVEASLRLAEALHERWAVLWRSLGEGPLGEEQWGRTYVHPVLGPVRLDTALAMYAWHGRHHVAHVTTLRARRGW